MIKMVLNKSILSLILAALTLYSREGMTQSLSVGKSLYQKGDMTGAEKALKKAMSSVTNKSEKARIALLLGIVFYTRGDQANSSTHFKNALALDPKIDINPQDILDPTVQSFFKKIKSEDSSTQASESSPPKQAQVGGATPLAPGAKPVKKTLLKIISNTPDAQVSIDGILAGSVNELINTDPGKVVVEVAAAGFQTIKTQVQIIENQENIISMTLEKARPKVKSQAPQEPNEAEVDSFGPIPVTKTAPKPRKGAKAALKNKSSKDDLFDPPAAAPTPAKARKKGRDLAREFEMDAAGGAPPPYPMQPNPYPPQGYGYTYPQPPPAYPSPGYAPPPYTESEPIYNQNGNYPPPPGTREYARGGPFQKSISLTSMIPFGVGQIAQKRYVLGTIFLASQIGLGYMSFDLSKQNEAYADSANLYLQENCTPSPNDKLSDDAIAACSQYESDSRNYLKGKRGEQQLYLVGAVLVGLAGIGEAIIWDTSDHRSETGTSSRKKRPKPIKAKKYKGFSLRVPPSTPPSLALITQKIDPNLSFNSMENLPPIALEWRWIF